MSFNAVTPAKAAAKACYQLSGSEKPFSCMADRCMAWRWANDAVGYCGIAGRPEAPTDELLSRIPELTDLFRAVLK